jgi:prepilin-type processing-associated H-X9-DG protein
MNTPHPHSATRSPSAAFSLVEILVVIAILAALVALLLPTVGKTLGSARGVTTVSNLRQIYTICAQYAADNNGDYPLFFRDNLIPPGRTDADYWYSVVRRNLFPSAEGWQLPIPSLDVRNTVLWSRNAERTRPPTIDSYGGNLNLGYHPTLNPSQKLMQTFKGGTTVMFADVMGNTRILTPNYGSSFGKLNARNGASKENAMDGVAHVLFLDGHGETLTARQAVTLNQEKTNTFWADRAQ